MNNLQELQEYTGNEWGRELSKSERELIQNVASVQSRRTISAIRYDPMFSYGSEEHEIWRVTLVDGDRKTLDIQSGGNTDGLWFIMEVK